MTGDNAQYWQNIEIFLTCIMISMNSFQGEKSSNQKWCLVRSINGADYANEFRFFEKSKAGSPHYENGVLTF